MKNPCTNGLYLLNCTSKKRDKMDKLHKIFNKGRWTIERLRDILYSSHKAPSQRSGRGKISQTGGCHMKRKDIAKAVI